MRETLPASWTVIAATGEQFSGFGPYVPSVNDAGLVAFQATVAGGGSGVFTGGGGDSAELVGSNVVAWVTSHPDVNLAGAVSFYGDRPSGSQGAFLLREGMLQTLADAPGRFFSIGPLGPTMNETGVVGFRADPRAGASGIYVADADGVRTVADTDGGWARFHGLPVVEGSGTRRSTTTGRSRSPRRCVEKAPRSS